MGILGEQQGSLVSRECAHAIPRTFPIDLVYVSHVLCTNPGRASPKPDIWTFPHSIQSCLLLPSLLPGCYRTAAKQNVGCPSHQNIDCNTTNAMCRIPALGTANTIESTLALLRIVSASVGTLNRYMIYVYIHKPKKKKARHISVPACRYVPWRTS